MKYLEHCWVHSKYTWWLFIIRPLLYAWHNILTYLGTNDITAPSTFPNQKPRLVPRWGQIMNNINPFSIVERLRHVPSYEHQIYLGNLHHSPFFFRWQFHNITQELYKYPYSFQVYLQFTNSGDSHPSPIFETNNSHKVNNQSHWKLVFLILFTPVYHLFIVKRRNICHHWRKQYGDFEKIIFSKSNNKGANSK